MFQFQRKEIVYKAPLDSKQTLIYSESNVECELLAYAT
jgi:hypothetical protein